MNESNLKSPHPGPLRVAATPDLILLTGHTAPIETAAFSPDGRLLATSGRDRRVILWESNTGTVRRVWELEETSGALAFSADGKTLFTNERSVNAWSMESGRWEGRISGLEDTRWLSVNGPVLTAVQLDRVVRVESDCGRFLGEIPFCAEQALSPAAVAFSGDGSTLSAGILEDGIYRLRVWDLHSGTLNLHRSIPRRFWWRERDPSTGKLRRTHGAQGDVESLALSPNGRLLAVGGTFTLWLCDTRTGRRTRLLACGCGAFRSLAISPTARCWRRDRRMER